MSVELNKRQAEFFLVMFLIIIGVMTFITVIDIATKTAIIEQATKLRLMIEGQYGQITDRPDRNRASNNGTDDSSVPGNVLDLDATRLETRSSDNGSKTTPAGARKRRAQSSRATRSTEVSSGDKPMGSGDGT
jgi:hypothetical protein